MNFWTSGTLSKSQKWTNIRHSIPDVYQEYQTGPPWIHLDEDFAESHQDNEYFSPSTLKKKHRMNCGFGELLHPNFKG